MALLRNLNRTFSGKRVFDSPYLGLAVSDLPMGASPPGLLENDVQDTDAPGTLYAVRIKSFPSAGTYFFRPDGSFDFTDAPDGVYTGSQEVRKYHPTDGLITAELTTYSITVGSTTDTTAPVFTGTMTVNSITSSSAVVDWSATTHTDNVGITGYEWSLDNTTWTATGSTATSKAFSSLLDDTDYIVFIRARDAAGNRSSALSVPFRTAPVAGTVIQATVGMAYAGGARATIRNVSSDYVPSPNRTLVVSLDESIVNLPIYRKTSYEELDYTFDWSRVMALATDAIADFSIEENGSATEGSTVQNGTQLTVWMSDGDEDSETIVTCKVTTLQGRKYARSFRLQVVAVR